MLIVKIVINLSLHFRFLMVDSGTTRKESLSPKSAGDDDENTPKYTPRRRGSWRQEIFKRVVTPARAPDTPTVLGKYTPRRRGSWRQEILKRVVTPARAPDTPIVLSKYTPRGGARGNRRYQESCRHHQGPWYSYPFLVWHHVWNLDRQLMQIYIYHMYTVLF